MNGRNIKSDLNVCKIHLNNDLKNEYKSLKLKYIFKDFIFIL